MAARPKLLLCFDAFGTLFRPIRPVVQQYGEVARQLGITHFTDDELQSSFRAAFKDEAKLNPNYGRSTNLGATRWWTHVIHRTFTPLLKDGEALPPDLAPTLLHRFSSSEGYKAEPQVVASVKALRAEHDGCKKSDWFEQIVVGVITNSDDRVPDILSSLGFDVSPLRYGTAFDLATVAETQRSHDIDFHCMSYDVGVEKPDKRVFEAAEMMLAQVLETREGRGPDEPLADAAASWQKLYVGDEFAKDVVGAQNAGWRSILLVAQNGSENASQHIDVPTIEESSGTSFKELFRDHSYATATSIQNVVSWIRGEERTPGR